MKWNHFDIQVAFPFQFKVRYLMVLRRSCFFLLFDLSVNQDICYIDNKFCVILSWVETGNPNARIKLH
jgi:hypothetical protein